MHPVYRSVHGDVLVLEALLARLATWGKMAKRRYNV